MKIGSLDENLHASAWLFGQTVVALDWGCREGKYDGGERRKAVDGAPRVALGQERGLDDGLALG